MQLGLKASAWSSVEQEEQPALRAVEEGATASIADGIFPGSRVFPEHCFSLSFFPVQG